MMARRMHDGTIRIDVSPEELRVVVGALERDQSRLLAQASVLLHDARHRRALADKYKRGRHANLREAGEREHEAAALDNQERQAADMCRVLRPFVSAIGEPSRSQLPTPGQIREDP